MKTMVKTILFAAIVSTTQAQTQTEDALKIDSNGNVGINTSTTPTEKLEVNGNVKAIGNVTATGNINATTVNATTVNATGKVQEKGNDLLPKGAIIMWYGGTTAPAGWAICDGTYNSTYGGDLPDLRGRFIVGVGKSNNGDTTYALKATGGKEKVQLSQDEMPRHSHVLESYKEANSNDQGWPNHGFKAVYSTDRTGRTSSEPIHPTGENQPHENRPPYYALYYIIKL